MTWLLSILIVLISRVAWHRAMTRMRIDGRLAYATLLVGTNDETERLAVLMKSSADLGFRPVGCVRTGQDPVRSLHYDDQLLGGGLRVVGDLAGLARAIHKTGPTASSWHPRR